MLVKYPKTMHLPWSPGLQNDDRVITTLDHFAGEEVVVTEKMDGENTTLYHNHIHARSLDGRHHPSRDWVKGFHGGIRYLIPEHLRICGENMYAQHSVVYDNLDSYFLGFNVWTNKNVSFSWDRTLALFDKLGITPVPVLWRGTWENFLAVSCGYSPKDLIEAGMCHNSSEGYVVRVTRAFELDEFQKVVAKYVRKNHVQTDQHWMAKAVVPNGLARDIR